MPTAVLLNELQTLLSQDTNTLAPAAGGCKAHLIASNFSPGANTDFGTLTEASFTGYAALVAGVGNQQAFFDTVANKRVVQMLEPAGGWHWQATAGTGLPMTIYGWCLTNNAGTVTYGSGLFTPPRQLLASGDAVDIDQLRFEIPANALQ